MVRLVDMAEFDAAVGRCASSGTIGIAGGDRAGRHDDWAAAGFRANHRTRRRRRERWRGQGSMLADSGAATQPPPRVPSACCQEARETPDREDSLISGGSAVVDTSRVHHITRAPGILYHFSFLDRWIHVIGWKDSAIVIRAQSPSRRRDDPGRPERQWRATRRAARQAGAGAGADYYPQENPQPSRDPQQQ